MKKLLSFLLGMAVLILYSTFLIQMVQEFNNKTNSILPGVLTGMLAYILVYGFHKWLDDDGY